MDLSRRSRLPPLILFIVLLCVQTSQSRFFGERQKRQNGANMYLPASSIIPGGEGEDPNEWTEWSSPSECSRSCGGGVSYQTRECLRTAPNGAPLCEGGNRKYFSCNTQDCPEEEPDFRAQQCSRFNHQAFDGIFYEWVPYTNAPNPCELNCMPKGERFYYRHKAKVIDGTRCNDQDLDVCVDGQCQPVGCDMMLGSNAKEDNCRKCGGDGTTCRTIADRFTTSNLAAGYNDLLLVPNGATNIRIQETAPSNNYLACRNLSSHYYLNGNWRIDFPRPMLFAGSWWNYQRKPTGFAAPDQLSCRGPITESIYIVMLVQDKNVSIDYEYSIPQSVSSSTPDVYTWTHMEYGPCSASCGGGSQTRAVTCNNRLNLEQVDPSFCDEKAKPAESQECGTEPCAPHWVNGEWGKCSKGCGSDGIQNRSVSCERISPTGEHTVEDDAVCLEKVGNKPANQQECNRDVKNCPKYHLGPWTPCDKLCGEGKQTRKVTCFIEENGRKKVVDDEECIEEKPVTEKECMLTPCEGVDWIISQWSGCDACGQTTETRTAICGSKSGKIYPDEFCAPEVPLLSRSCESTKCKTQWFTSEWSKCSSSCGKGAQSRVVLCGEFDGKTITKVADDSQCDAATRPESTQECEGEADECPGEWFTGPWESCSKPCGGGERKREVLCLANGTKSTNCDESKIESLSEKCNTQACTEDEVLPVESTDKPLTDEEDEEDCEEEEEDDDNKLVTDKMSDDLKISDGIDLDEESTMSSLMTDDLMLSDSTPASETTDEDTSTDLPFTTVEGSGDETESTDRSSIVTEGSGDDQAGSTETTDSLSGSTGLESTDVSTESSVFTDTSELTDSSTESSVSTDISGSESTDSSSESPGSTDSSQSTDSSTDISGSTDSTDSSTDISGSTDSSQSTDVSESTDSSASTDTSESTEPSTGASISTESSLSTDSSGSTYSSLSTDASTESTDKTTDDTSLSTDASASTESSTVDTSTDSSDSTESSTSDSTESSVSTDSTTESSTESSVSTESSTDISSSTDASTSTDISSSTDVSTSTDISLSTDTSLSTESSASTDASSSTDASAPTDSSSSTDSSVSTDASAITDGSMELSSTDSSASTDASSDSTESSITSSDLSTESTISAATDSSTESSGDTETSSDSGISEATDFSSESTNVSEAESDATESSTTDVSGATSTDETTDISSDDVSSETTMESGSTEETTDIFGLSSTTESMSTSSDIFDSTTESSDDSSTDDFTTVDIWTTEEDFEKSTPNTLEAAITKESKSKKCKPKKPKDCKKSEHGCCPDGKHIAKGPFDEGCPIAKTCAETEFGCCHDGLSPAEGKNYKGCPKSQCAETLFGCCPDKFTPAEGEDNEGCPEPTTLPPTTTTELSAETETESIEADSSDMPETTEAVMQSCSFSKFGCCPDGETSATGENFAGCDNVVDTKDCRNSIYGCCHDGRTSATGPDNEGCPSCTSEPYGCCPDKETPAHGPLGEGCCLNSPFGCCPDNINSARGPNFEDCDCKYAPYGCCPDEKTAARGPSNEGCGCESSQFGCCPDKLTASQGPKFEGCACHTLQFGCCPDGITVAQGPHHYGCHCSQTEFKCCPDEKTPAKGLNNEGCTCLESKYGCCPDGITSAQGDKFEGCENVKEPPQLACKLPKETGPCGNFSIKFFFDTSYGACAKFWYGGCEGNGNKFESESECKETCQDYKGKEACLLPKSQGPCTGSITKWYFDADRGRCEEFKYGGCYGTNNRFDSLEDCQSLCTVSESIPPCEQPMDEGPCEGNFERWFYDNATDICRPFRYGGCKGNKNNYPTEHACNYHCRQPGVHKDYCSLPKQTGDCSEKHARWYYSEEDKKCTPFYYTGCGGNKNNFPSLESCEDHCPKQVVMDVCEIPAEVGECTNYEPMWYYDTKDQHCRQFYYGGCGGNENKFTSEEACLQRCEKKPEPEPEREPERVRPPDSVNVCEQKADRGGCANYTLWWYFDKDNSACDMFYYGGCEGNGNRFRSKEECERQCIGEPQPRESELQPKIPAAPIQPDETSDENVCLLSEDTGNCDNYVPMYYFDSKATRCKQFYYGGCGGNGNRFATEEECNNRCGPEPDFKVRLDTSDLDTSPETDDTRKCYLPVATGNCLDNQPRWYYNSADGVCDQFAYTGCDGNANNYATEAECEDECFPVHETCVLPPLRGNCNESLIRWHFNPETGSCNEFEFTGCRGNRNNFVTEQECMSRCGSDQPPAPTYSVCDQPLEAGECDNSTTAWYYDNESMICVAFTYTGCGGNGNRFQSKEQCERQCGEFKGVDVCNEDVATGPCRQWQVRYYFNRQSHTCEPFTYGGCQGTGNRFENRGECEAVCIIGQEPIFTQTKDICKQQVDVGRCNGPSVNERRWYYDDARGNCVSFIYSGCAGNQNNFRSYESCYSFCSKPDVTNEVLPNRCEQFEHECNQISCPYGVRRVPVDEECQRCECNNPCSDYACADDEQCAIEISSEVSGQFVPVCRPTNKPGICPQLTANDGVCGRECYTDADCRSDNKCCSNGCGFVCVRPSPPTIRTTAPTTPAPVVVYPGEVRVALIPKQKPELDVQTPMGGIAVLRCFATGNPAPNVTWSRNNVVVDTNQGRYVLTSSGDLTIVQVRQTDSGSYVCIASNGLGEPVRREVELQVTEPVNMPAYVYGDRNVTQIVTLNRPAVVRCPAGGHPAPMVHWWRNRSRLPLVSQRFELARDYSLTFRSIQLSDLGPYTCEAWNRLSRRPASIKVTLVAVGPARAITNEDAEYLQYIIEPPKAPVTLRPSYPYRPTRPPAIPPPYVPAIPVNAVVGMDPNNNYTPGSTIAMGCSVQGYPQPNVTWIKDGLPLVPSERVQISVGEPHRLIINNVSMADSGRYGCKAANAVSYSISEETVHIESTIPLSPECVDNEHFANCKLIVKGRYCKNKYYARFCCRSCALAGQLN